MSDTAMVGVALSASTISKPTFPALSAPASGSAGSVAMTLMRRYAADLRLASPLRRALAPLVRGLDLGAEGGLDARVDLETLVQSGEVEHRDHTGGGVRQAQAATEPTQRLVVGHELPEPAGVQEGHATEVQHHVMMSALDLR